MSYVMVERLPFGSSSFTGCTADVFSTDVLNISCTHPDFDAVGPMEVYQPQQWARATVYDERGNVLFDFQSEAGKHRWDAKVETT